MNFGDVLQVCKTLFRKQIVTGKLEAKTQVLALEKFYKSDSILTNFIDIVKENLILKFDLPHFENNILCFTNHI